MNARFLESSRLAIRLLIAALVLGISACDKSPSASTDSIDRAAQEDVTVQDHANVLDPEDPCRLLEASEVETLLGAKLAGAPFRSGAPNGDRAGIPEIGGPACWYETADFRNVAVQATWEDAGAVSAAVSDLLGKAEHATDGLLKLKDGSELTGEWDEARIQGCCNFVALRGDAMVEIDFGGAFLDEAAAAKLADAALPRFEAPLAVNGDAGVAAAIERSATRAVMSDPCSLWSADDIGAALDGKMSAAPEAHGNECEWHFDNAGGRNRLFVSTVDFRNGNRRFTEDNATYGGFAASLNNDTDGVSMLREAAQVSGPWDRAEDGPIQFNTVRRDLKIAIRHGGISLDQLRALLERAYVRLGIEPKVAS